MAPSLLTAIPDTSPARDTASPMRVLLVDDTADIRVMVRMAMERWGDFVVVAEAADGITAVSAASALQPDVVVLDAAMPSMDGLTALPLIKQASPDAQVVMLSGFSAGEISRRAVELGAVGYAVKGGPVRDLVAWISGLVEATGTEGPAPAPRA